MWEPNERLRLSQLTFTYVRYFANIRLESYAVVENLAFSKHFMPPKAIWSHHSEEMRTIKDSRMIVLAYFVKKGIYKKTKINWSLYCFIWNVFLTFNIMFAYHFSEAPRVSKCMTRRTFLVWFKAYLESMFPI